MSTAVTELEQLLRGALNQAATKIEQADTDLLAIASEAAEAVQNVTDGAATLDFVPINRDRAPCSTNQILLRKNNSTAPPVEVGLFGLSEAEYPIRRWYTRENRESRPDQLQENVDGVRGYVRWLLSKPKSKLVVSINYLMSGGSPR